MAFCVCTIGPALEAEVTGLSAGGELLKAVVLDAIGSVAAEAAADAHRREDRRGSGARGAQDVVSRVPGLRRLGRARAGGHIQAAPGGAHRREAQRDVHDDRRASRYRLRCTSPRSPRGFAAKTHAAIAAARIVGTGWSRGRTALEKKMNPRITWWTEKARKRDRRRGEADPRGDRRVRRERRGARSSSTARAPASSGKSRQRAHPGGLVEKAVESRALQDIAL